MVQDGGSSFNLEIQKKQLKNYYSMKHIIPIFLLWISLGTVVAQQTISGKVNDAEGNPLQNASVLEKGTSNGVLTNLEGAFSIEVPNGAIIEIRYSGFQPQEIVANGQRNLIVNMVSNTLNEVVVIGYGSRDKGDLTGAISSINSEEIAKSDFITPELAMQGRMAGVFVGTPSGDPNARPEVRIRGIGTIGVNEPLYVIDGIPVTEFGSGSVYSTSQAAANDLRGTLNIFNLINPNDIESISVLKDASAAAIYGVRASNGVVLITTKRGKVGKPVINFKASVGVGNVPETFEVLGTSEYTALHQEMYQNNPVELPNLPAVFNPDTSAFLGNSPTYDWQDAIVNDNARYEDYAMNITGGNQNSTYAFSAGYSYAEGSLRFNNTERYTLGINSDHKINDWLTVGETFRFAYIDAVDQRNLGDLGLFGVAPWQPFLDPNGPGGFAPSRILDENFGVIDAAPYGPETNNNIFGIERFTDRDWTQLRNLGSVYAEIEPVRGLRFKGTVSGDWFYTRRNTWNDVDFLNFRDGNASEGNTYGERHNRNFNITREFSINYNNSFGDHNIDLLANGMWQDYGAEIISASRINVFSDNPDLRGIPEGDRDQTAAGTFREEYALQGYLGRLSYSFKNKYYLDATVRRDGTSRFSPEYRWGTFPSVSGAWRITEERFMENVGFINDLKVRGGWGQLGNQETRPYAFLSLLNLNPRFPLGQGPQGSNFEGAFLPNFPVEDLSWETTTTVNVGFDAVLFNNTTTLTVEWYDRETDGILQAVALPLVVGNTIDPVFNIARVRNRGFEFAAGFNQKYGDLNFSVNANLTTVDNEVLELANGDPLGGNFNRIEEGRPLNYLWGYQSEGIFQTQEEVNAYTSTTTDQLSDDTRRAAGDMYFADLFGNPTDEGEFRSEGADGQVNTLDQTFLGNTIPGYFYGFNFGLDWKGIDVSVFFQGVGDVQKVNFDRWRGESMSSQGVNQWTTTRNRWTPSNPSTTMPRAMAADPTGNTRFSDRWVEDAGFMRLKNFQLGYTLPENLRRVLGNAQNIRIYVSGTNTLLFTDWTGIDPENDSVPPPRIFTVGANLTF